MKLFDHGFSGDPILDMQDIESDKTYPELIEIGRQVALDIQKKYELSYAEAELVLSVTAVTLKNQKMATV